jgi:hypothetical protein
MVVSDRCVAYPCPPASAVRHATQRGDLGAGAFTTDTDLCRSLPSLIQQRSIVMTDASSYTPPAIWTWNRENGGRFAAINRPIAGATHDKALPVGRHPLQLYSLGTPMA